MSDDKRLAKRKKQMDELYAAIGEFVVKFEFINFYIEKGIILLLQSQGLRSQQVAQILIAGQTAEPLKTNYQSLIYQTQNLNPTEKLMIENAFKRLVKVIEARNDIIHSTWFIGWGNETTEDFSVASSMKSHKNKSGAAIKSFDYQVNDFKNLIDETEELSKIFSRLSSIYIWGHSIERNFIIKSDGNLSVPENT